MTNPIEILEAYPDYILARMENRERARKAEVPSHINDVDRELVFEDLKLWQIGKLKVSFKGGSPELHKKIADIANEWAKYGNIEFDFGYDPATGYYRSWTPIDNSHIRVGFQYSGYWSLVGTDSKDPLIAQDGDITLNLSGFDIQLPTGWAGTVLHEFGHALGFHHEHQSPAGNCDFDWDKLYEYLAKPPNEWSKVKVDHNMRQLPGGGLTFSAHDKTSIMHYSFPSWMFKKGEQSTCFTLRNDFLSDMDKTMMGEAYPQVKEAFEKLTNNRVNNLEKIVSAASLKDDSTRSYFNQHLEYLKNEKESENLFE